MYDTLRASYRFHCPHRPDGRLAEVPLSAFRRLERLPGSAHPAVFRVEYGCGCGEEHQGLLTHADLDYGPLAPVGTEYRNLITGRMEPVGDELAEHARGQVQRGNWPWRLYCSHEGHLRPVWPSSLEMVARAARGDGCVGVLLRCPGCAAVSVNLVSEAHLDVPFYHDPVVRYVDRPYGDGRDITLERFHDQLHSARFDSERAGLPDV